MNRELLIEQLEQRLEITLPRGLRSLLEAAPARDMWYKGYLCCDAERLLVFNLELREGGDYYGKNGDQPWPRDHLAICLDGCGNYFCIKVGNGPPYHMYKYEHDPPTDLIVDEENGAKEFFEGFKLNPGDLSVVNLDESGAPEHWLVVCRTDRPWKGILNPISLKEWMQLVEQDETLSTNNQFTKLMGAIVDVDKERYSHVVVSFKKYHIEYSLGVLFTKSTDDEIRTKLDGFAQVLSAHLIECCPGALAPCY